MELVGLALAIPAVIAANVVYVLAVRFGIARFTKLQPWLLWPSYVVVALALLDVCLVLMELIRSRGRVNYGRRAQPVSALDENQQALGGDDLSIRRAVVAAGERPTVI